MCRGVDCCADARQIGRRWSEQESTSGCQSRPTATGLSACHVQRVCVVKQFLPDSGFEVVEAEGSAVPLPDGRTDTVGRPEFDTPLSEGRKRASVIIRKKAP